ncbi:MAG: hypothetical protein EAZ40_09375, partial [Rhodobacterales bacterium]
GPLLLALHAIQDELGYIPQQAIAVIADSLNLSRAEVHGVVTFYHDFREAPAGRHVLKLCRAEACQAMGADRLAGAWRHPVVSRCPQTPRRRCCRPWRHARHRRLLHRRPPPQPHRQFRRPRPPRPGTRRHAENHQARPTPAG